MNIYIVGNNASKGDDIPSRIMNNISASIPRAHCICVDPTENFIPEEESVIIDSVDGIKDVAWFYDIDAFVATKSVSPHDYDLGLHLQLLKKLKKVTHVRILGVPRSGDIKKITKRVISEVRALLSLGTNSEA